MALKSTGEMRPLAQAAIDALARAGGVYADAARDLGVAVSTLRSRIKHGQLHGLEASAIRGDDEATLKLQNKRMAAELGKLKDAALEAEAIRRSIVGLQQNVAATRPPQWTLNHKPATKSPGVPTLFLSDFHWGEHVDPAQINGLNEFNVDIAHTRLKSLVSSAIQLLEIISPKLDYPGIVVPLGGDMVSGNIHDELSATNEMNTMPTVLDMYGELVAAITHLADKFGKVFVPCVTGNHGRDTHKIWSKDRHATSFDWLLYCFLAKHFESVGDKRVSFFIPDGSDALYKVYNTRYLLTHGDQFRGGDSMIGPLGPLTRGDHKKRGRNSQVGQDYDVMIVGHFHTYTHSNRIIINGSLKGYDEYAYGGNFGFEPPQQALWITHPNYGITYRMPILLNKMNKREPAEWVGVFK